MTARKVKNRILKKPRPVKTKPRPERSRYRPSYNKMAFLLCSRHGADDAVLAEYFSVSRRTVERWKVEHPEFYKQILAGKEQYDVEVIEAALFKRAKGYECEELHYERRGRGKKAELVLTKRIKKGIVPDSPALFFWLCNRQPQRWASINIQRFQNADGSNLPVVPVYILPDTKKPQEVQENKP